MRRESILNWFEKQQEEAAINSYESEDPLVGQWEVDPNSPVPIERRDGKFFKVVNIAVEAGGNREVTTWEQPMVQPVDTMRIQGKDINGIVALFRRKMVEKIKYLVQAKAEPGNDTLGRVVLAPTIQASASNMTLHRNKIPFLNEFDLNSKDTRHVVQPKDGGRFFRSNNIVAMQDVEHIKKVPPNFIWATRAAIRELQQKGLVNEHLNEIFGAFS